MFKKALFACLLMALAQWAVGQSAIRVNDLTGINAHPNDPLAPQLRFSWVRSWHDWSDDIGFGAASSATCLDLNTPSQWKLQWSPSANISGKFLNYDNYFAALGSRTIPVLKGIDPRMRGYTNYSGCGTTRGGYAPMEQKPFCLTQPFTSTNNCTLPRLDFLPTVAAQETASTFKQHALWMSMFAAKFGNKKYTSPFATPYMQPGEIIGRDYLQYIEDNNEPNKSWYDNLFPGEAHRTGLSAGTYTVTVVDASGCTQVQTFTVGTSTNLQLELVVSPRTKANCTAFGGRIEMSPHGGTGPYVIAWNNNQITGVIDNLSLGSYTVSVTDAGGCTGTASASIVETPGPFVEAYNVNNSNCGSPDKQIGSIYLKVNGGAANQPGYLSMWQYNNGTPYPFNGNQDLLPKGNYSITVTDPNQCTTIVARSITDVLTLTGTAFNAGCGQTNNGEIILNAAGGTKPYKFKWADQDEVPDLATGRTWWYFTPKQFAAMTSADYDGRDAGLIQLTATHISLTDKVGIANSSNGMNFVLGGLSGLHGKYVAEMHDHWITLRGNTPDYISNFHHYSTDLSSQQSVANFGTSNGEYQTYQSILLDVVNGKGAAPEIDHLRDKLKALGMGLGTKKGKEMWLTEFGYDTFGGHSPTNSSGVEAEAIPYHVTLHPDGPYDSQKVAAQWTVRGVLEAAWTKEVDKMTLYELADHPTDGKSTYDYSGLLTYAGAAKRGWFYVMTLKNVLGESTFNKEIVNDPPNGYLINQINNNSGQAPRVYEFSMPDPNGGSATPVFAIWSPTATAASPYKIDLTLPSGYIFSKATLTEIEEMNEKGRKTIWTGHITGQKIKDIPVSETPVFLVLNKEITDPYAPCLTNLTATPVCCGGVHLSWALSGPSANTLIYYQPCPTDCNSCGTVNFDPETATLFSNQTGPYRTSIDILGLKPTSCYKIWVIPVNQAGSPSPNPGLCPGMYSNAITFQPSTGCPPTPAICLINIAESELYFDPQYGPNMPLSNMRPAILADAVSLLSADGISNDCSEINAGSLACPNPDNGWDYYITPDPYHPDINSIFVKFTTPKTINAIYAQDWSGNGTVRIEYRDCICPRWKKFVDIDLTGINGVCYNDVDVGTIIPLWLNISNLTQPTIKELRITKINNPGGNPIRRLYFCGADKVCDIVNISGGSKPYPQSFRADEVRKNSVSLQWDAALLDDNNPTAGWEQEYEVSISQNLDANNQLANPVTLPVGSGPFEQDVRFHLGGLAPGTTYFAELAYSSKNVWCGPPVANAKPRVSFTTESLNAAGRSNAAPKSVLESNVIGPFSVMLQPNPTSGLVQVSLSDGNIASISVFDISGRTIKLPIIENIQFWSLETSGLITGSYWIRVVRKDGSRQTVQLFKT